MALTPVRHEARSRHWWHAHLNEIGLLLALLAMVVVFSQTAPNFLTDRNLVNILRSAAYVGIIAFPMTFVIIAGEIDISVGPSVAFFGVAFAQFVAAFGIPIPLALILVVFWGCVFGGCAGWLRVHYSVPTFISTLALWGALRGGALWWTDALPVIIPSREFRAVLGGNLFGLPVVALIMLTTFVVFAYLARLTRYGRHIYALGANPEAVAALGINVTRLRVTAMATTGAFAALVGVLIDARLGSGNANAATGPTNPAAGVIEARPAIVPVTIPTIDALPNLIRSQSAQANDAVAADMLVTVRAIAAPPSAASADPPFKRNQPTQSMAAPTRT